MNTQSIVALQIRYLCCLLVLAILPGCAGGTGGSSSTSIVSEKNFSGSLVDGNSNAIAGAVILVSESGDSGVTDSNGEFAFKAKVSDALQTIVVTRPDGKQASVNNVAANDGENFSLDFIFDSTLILVLPDSKLVVEVGGRECMDKFSAITIFDEAYVQRQLARNGLVIVGFDQLGPVADGSTCNFQGQFTKNGAPLSGISWRLSTGGCLPDVDEERTILSSGETQIDGTFTASFRFAPRVGRCNWGIEFDGALTAPVIVVASSAFERENY